MLFSKASATEDRNRRGSAPLPGDNRGHNLNAAGLDRQPGIKLCICTTGHIQLWLKESHRASEVGAAQVGVVQDAVTQVGASKVGIAQVGVVQTAAMQVSAAQVGAAQGG